MAAAWLEVAFSRQLAQRTTRAWRFTRLQVIRQRCLVAQLPHRNGRVQRITFRNVQLLAGQFLIETGHAMGVPAADARLQRQVTPRRTGVKGVPQGRGFFGRTRHGEGGFRDHDHQRRGVLRPAAVEFVQQAQVTLPVWRIATRIQKPPRLRVVGRRCPAGGFEEAQQRFFRDGFAGERAGRPAIGELRMDGVVGNAWISTHQEIPCYV